MRWPRVRRRSRPPTAWSPFVSGTRATLAVRGAVAVLVAAVVYAFCFAWGSQAFVSNPQVSVVVPASAGALNVDSSVQYHGVNVGKVAAIDAGTQSSTVRLGLTADGLGRIPADVQVRLVPRTIFGDFYVDLVTPPQAGAHGAPAPALRPGDTLLADQSRATVQLYQAFSRIYDLISAIDPAALNTALTAVATALHGQGAALGQAIDALDRTLAASQPVFDHLGADLDGVATLSGELNAVAPDLLASLNNAITTSRTIVDKQQAITAILAAGTQASGQATQLIGGDNRNRIITLVGDTDPLLQTLNAKPDQLTTIYQGLQQLVNKLPAAAATGPWLNTDVRLSLDGLAPYQPAQCPRYGTLAGPNCPASAAPGPVLSGSAGPVGSPGEKAQMAAMFGQNADLDSILAGPILRGTTVRS